MFDSVMPTAGMVANIVAAVIGVLFLTKSWCEFRGRITRIPVWAAKAATVAGALCYLWVAWEVAEAGFYSFALIPLYMVVAAVAIRPRGVVRYWGLGPDRFANELERQVVESGRTIVFALDGIWISGLSGPLNSGDTHRSELSSLEALHAADASEASRWAESVVEALSRSKQPNPAAGVRGLILGLVLLGLASAFAYGRFAGHLS
jgi:hypothetical protein